jgi:hypothetical protein
VEVRAQRDGSGNCSLHIVNVVPQRQQDEWCTLPCTTACSPYTMTLPGADTMNGGIIGDDCFLFKGGLGDVEGAGEDILEVNCARRGSAGEVSEAEEECDTERCWCVSVTADPNQPQLPEYIFVQPVLSLTRRGEICSASATVHCHARVLKRAFFV